MGDQNIQVNQYNRPAVQSNAASAVKTTAGTGFSKVLQNAVSSAAAQQPTDMDEIFSRAASQFSVPENLLKAVAKAESGFDADAVSRCGAQGVMQLMPSTAKSLGVENPLDAEQNIMGGAKYLSQMLDRYDGDAKLALAAYNAGSGNVKKYGGIPPFKETQTYVKRVMDYAGMNLDAPSVSSSALPESLAALNANSVLSSLGVLNSLGGSSSSGALSSLLGAAATGTGTYTYDDYLNFLQVWVAQMQASGVQLLTGDDAGSDSETSYDSPL